MNIILWILQILLGGLFLAAGGLKATQTKEQIVARVGPQMAPQMGWLNDFTQEQVRGIGIVEVLGGLGLILSMLLGILKVLTPLAAFALTVDMLGAAYTHYRRKEQPPMLMTLGIAAVLFFVFLGRSMFESVV